MRRGPRAQVGMRRVEVAGRQLRVNGRPILLKGVNRHEHDERRGKAVTEAGMVRDIQLLKQFNFNSVRCAHYPNHPRWRAPAPRAAAPAESGRLVVGRSKSTCLKCHQTLGKAESLRQEGATKAVRGDLSPTLTLYYPV